MRVRIRIWRLMALACLVVGAVLAPVSAASPARALASGNGQGALTSSRSAKNVPIHHSTSRTRIASSATTSGQTHALMLAGTASTTTITPATLTRRVSAAATLPTSTITTTPTTANAPVIPASSGGGLTWNTSLTSLAQITARPAVTVGNDGNIYAFGGTNGDNADYNTTLIYHPSTNTWSQGATMPTAREGAQAVTLPDGRIAVLGGGAGCHYTQTNCTIYNIVEVYTPSSNT